MDMEERKTYKLFAIVLCQLKRIENRNRFVGDPKGNWELGNDNHKAKCSVQTTVTVKENLKHVRMGDSCLLKQTILIFFKPG